MIDLKDLLEHLPEAPTLVQLRKKEEENLIGSPLKKKRRSNGGDIYAYEDESILVYDSKNGVYHFLTEEGRNELLTQDRRAIHSLIYGREIPTKYEKLGSGNFSTVYSLPSAEGMVMKVTDATNFLGKELSDVFSNAYDDLIGRTEMGRKMRGGKKIVQYIDLRTVLGLLTALKTNHFATPEFYGFSIREHASGDTMQEYQFMQRIDRPTLEQVFENTNLTGDPEINYEAIPHNQIIRKARKHFESDDELLGTLAEDYHQFRSNVKRVIFDIGDVEMPNLFLYGFNPTSRKFTLMIIDPIKEKSYIRVIKTKENLIPSKNLKRINYEIFK